MSRERRLSACVAVLRRTGRIATGLNILIIVPLLSACSVSRLRDRPLVALVNVYLRIHLRRLSLRYKAMPAVSSLIARAGITAAASGGQELLKQRCSTGNSIVARMVGGQDS
jgi:hypothetical protein